MNTLILGGARSGKSQFAEQLMQTHAQQTSKELIYIATAQSLDDEMQARITRHKQDRAALAPHIQWQLNETPITLSRALQQYDSPKYAVLIDCLTLWISNCLHAEVFDHEQTQLLKLIPQLSCELCMISNEVGSGVVPMGQLSRQFVDASGYLHQALAKLCDQVILVVAGLPLNLKHTTNTGEHTQ